MFAPYQWDTGFGSNPTGLLHAKLSGRSVITEVLGGELKFEFFHRWFNSLFLASVALTLLLLYGWVCGLWLTSSHMQSAQHSCTAVLPC